MVRVSPLRDQSCTDVLELYHKVKTEASSDAEAEVRGEWST